MLKKGYARAKPGLQSVIQGVLDLEKRGSQAEIEAYASAIRHCGDHRALPQGRRVHALLDENGLGKDRFLGNLLIQMYGKCGSLEDACSVFHRMPSRNRFSWAIIMAAYAQNGHAPGVIRLFREMDLDGIKPDNVNFVNVLTACSHIGALAQGKALHERVTALGMQSDDILASAVITMYGRCRAAHEAKLVFELMPEKDIITWNAMLAAYAQNGHHTEAMDLYRELCSSNTEGDNVTYITMLYVCSCVEDLEGGMKIHAMFDEESINQDVILANAVLTMYYKCQRLDLAEEIFERMPSKSDATWNVMITAYTQSGQAKDALSLYRRMNQEGEKPGAITFMSVLDACCLLKDLNEGRKAHTWMMSSGFDQQVIMGTNVVNMYGKCGSVVEAKAAFEKLKVKTLVTWTAMIAAYAQNGCSREALNLYYQMEEAEGRDSSLKPDNIALITIVDACAKVGDLSEGKRIHERVVKLKLEKDSIVCNALITMYNKCGSLAGARSIFDGLKEPNVVSWNAMIAAYCEHGLNTAAVELFGQMLNVGTPPDDVTFVSILFACSHAGLFDRGWQNFQSMQQDFDVASKFEHFVCIADLLGRAGRLDEAEELLEEFPYSSTATAWNTLLSACKLHQNVDKGERIAEKIFKLDPQATGSYVLLSSMYSAVGRFADAARVRRLMEENCGMATRIFKAGNEQQAEDYLP